MVKQDELVEMDNVASVDVDGLAEVKGLDGVEVATSHEEAKADFRLFMYVFSVLHGLFMGKWLLLEVYVVGNVSSVIGPMILFIIPLYLFFYLTLFGRDEVKWLFIDAVLGMYAAYALLGTVVFMLCGKDVADFPVSHNVLPFILIAMYSFLLRQLALDLTLSRKSRVRRNVVEAVYVIAFVAFNTNTIINGV